MSIVGYLMFGTIPPTVSAGEIALLRRLLDEEENDTGEQLTRFSPGGWMLGSDVVSARVCFRLIRHCLIKRESSGNDLRDEEVIYWRLSSPEEAKRIIANPETFVDVVSRKPATSQQKD